MQRAEHLLKKYHIVKSEYQASGHDTKMRKMLEGDTWTIDRIVMIGIGNESNLCN